jgi:retinol dehydrogenase 12
MRWLMTHLLPHMPFATRADAAADSFVFMVLRPVTGRDWQEAIRREARIESSPESYDLDKARRFWELASQLTGLDAT